MTRILIGVAGGIVILWLALVAVLWLVRRRLDLDTLREGARILPDLLRLLKRLAADDALPWGVRARLLLLLAFVISPIDLIPDFIPVIGYLDDAVLVTLVLRSVVRRSGRQAIERHWPGTPDGLAAILRIAGIRDPNLPAAMDAETGQQACTRPPSGSPDHQSRNGTTGSRELVPDGEGAGDTPPAAGANLRWRRRPRWPGGRQGGRPR